MYYGLGGGFGHLTRFLAYCFTTKRRPALIASDSDTVRHLGIDRYCQVFYPPANSISPDELAAWLNSLVKQQKPEEFIVDAFPAGILGELSLVKEIKNISCTYLARILKWQKYLGRVRGNFPDYKKIYTLESLPPDQSFFLKENFNHIFHLDLEDQPHQNSDNVNLPEKEFWVVIHSAVKESKILVEYAIETARIQDKRPEILLITPGSRPEFLPDHIRHHDIYPANHIFVKAKKVFSAAGFNICRQMAAMREKHVILPFERSLDDQFFRAANIRGASAP
ncbi:MAG: hypothetical protein ACOYXC_08405 [Candidatus Rifleibacteriota bacterium]